jgi:hypothetical protein
MATEPRLGAALLGDVVASRQHPDQQRLFSLVAGHLEWVNRRVRALQPLQLTIGDEFQGLYERLEDAVFVSLLVRLRLAGQLALRFGIGWGPVITHAAIEAPAAQSGEAWWNAREALQLVARAAGRKKRWPANLGTWLVAPGREDAQWARAALILQDQVLAAMDGKDAAITLALLADERQVDLTDVVGLSQSTISHRQRERGPSALFRAHRELGVALEADPAPDRGTTP